MIDKKDDIIVFDGEVEDFPKIKIIKGEMLSNDVKPLLDKEIVVDALKLVFDPEVSIDVYNLGLIYDIDLKNNGDVKILMTLTSPTCPMADEMVNDVADTVASLDGVGIVEVEVVWEPVWDFSHLSEDAKFQMDIGDLSFD